MGLGTDSSGEGKPQCVGIWGHVCAYWVYACWRVCACVCSYTDIHVGGWVASGWQVAAGLRDLGEAERGEVPMHRAVGMGTAALNL